MSQIYSEILAAELERVDKEYSDPYVYSSAMEEYINNKMAVISQTLQDISYVATVTNDQGKPYDILSLMDVNHYGLQNDAILPSGDHAEVDTYSNEDRAELGDDYFAQGNIPSEIVNLVSSLSNRLLVGDDCFIAGSDLIRTMVKQRDGLYDGSEKVINTMNGLKVSGNDMMASIATQIAEFKIFSAGFKAVVESKTSSLSQAFANNIGLISDKFKEKSLSSIFYGIFNQAKGSAHEAVSGMMTMLTTALKSTVNSVNSDGSVTTVYTLGDYSGLTFSAALGFSDISGIGDILQNIVLIVGAAGYTVVNLIAKGFAMIGSAIDKFVRKYSVINQIEFKDGGENPYIDFPIISARYSLDNQQLLEYYGNSQIMGSIYTVDTFFHHLTDNPEFPTEYATSFLKIYESLGDDNNHWMVDLKFGLMFLSRVDGYLQMDIYLKPLIPDLDGYFSCKTVNDSLNYEKKNFVAKLADGTDINITPSLPWRSNSLRPERSLGLYQDYNSDNNTDMEYICGFVCDGMTNTQAGPQNETSFSTPSGYYPRSVINRIRSIFPIGGSKYWVFAPDQLIDTWRWNITDKDEARIARIYNVDNVLWYSHWTIIALLTYLWLRINAYVPYWDTIITTTNGDQMNLAHVDINHGLFTFQVMGQGSSAVCHLWSVGAYDVPGGSPVITYSSQISAQISNMTIDRSYDAWPITILARLCSYRAYYCETAGYYWDPNDPQYANWDVPNNFLITRLIFTSGTQVYNTISNIGTEHSEKRAMFTFGLSFFVGIWCQILLNKKEYMSQVYENWNDFPLFIPYNTVQQLPSPQFHIITSNELDSRAKVIPTVLAGAAIAIAAIAVIATTIIVVKKRLRNSLEMISVSSEAAKYAFEDDIKAFSRGEMSLSDFKNKKKDYLRLTKRNKLKSKILNALGVESISSSYFDLCAQDDQGTDSINTSSISEAINNTDSTVTISTEALRALIAG